MKYWVQVARHCWETAEVVVDVGDDLDGDEGEEKARGLVEGASGDDWLWDSRCDSEVSAVEPYSPERHTRCDEFVDEDEEFEDQEVDR